jgi:hypothetical protein
LLSHKNQKKETASPFVSKGEALAEANGDLSLWIAIPALAVEEGIAPCLSSRYKKERASFGFCP